MPASEPHYRFLLAKAPSRAICLREALQPHRYKHMPEISPVPPHYALLTPITLDVRLKTKNLHYICEDKVEEPAGDGSYDGRKAFIENRDRALSLRSVGSEDSGYSSGDAHSISKNLAAISEDGIDEHTEFGLFNGAKCESTSDLVNSFPFFTLTRLYTKPASSENLLTITDFIVAVSLADFSL